MLYNTVCSSHVHFLHNTINHITCSRHLITHLHKDVTSAQKQKVESTFNNIFALGKLSQTDVDGLMWLHSLT